MGETYSWLLDNIPLFVAFREPTKFLIVVAAAYSVLIGFAITHFYNILNGKMPIPTSLTKSKNIMLSK
ncbi:MAG: hypothetical protein QXZ17_10495 [Nitrososphaerota archaeon]